MSWRDYPLMSKRVLGNNEEGPSLKRLLLTIIVLMVWWPIWPTAAQDDSTTYPVTITDATGREVTITSIDRIVSGSGDITEIIVALGFEDNLVGVDISSTYPPDVLERVDAFGFARRLTLEPIVSMDPSVFFCTETCMPDVVLDQLRDLGIPVVIAPDGDDVDLDLPLEKVQLVASALGVAEKGAALSSQIATEIDWVRTATANVETKPYVLLLYFRGSRLQLVYGNNTPAEVLIEGAGGIEAAGEIGIEGYVPLNAEILLTTYPDYVLLMQSGIEGAGGLDVARDLQGMAQTPAGRNDNFLVYDDQYLLALSTRTGPMLLDLAADIHPDMTWEVKINYPYAITDSTGQHLSIDLPTEVATTTELQENVTALGFHPITIDEANPNSLIIMQSSDDWQTMRDNGYTVVVVSSADDITALAAGLGVPGRGEALLARRAQAR